MTAQTISVIIPVYNSENTIERCLLSVLNQTINVDEIIVINDGSSDNTEALVKSFKIKHRLNNLVILNQANAGPAAARNRGIIEASGEWIAFLDSDDRWLPDKMAKQIEVLRTYPNISIIGCNFFSNNSKHKPGIIKKVNFIGMLFKNILFTSTVLVKKNVIEEFYFDEKKNYSEDSKLWMQIIYANNGIVLSDELVVYAENQKKFRRKSLSAEIWKMEFNELDNYLFLFKRHSISIFLLIILLLFSVLKFIKRFISSIF
jgi:glycosyltransferase involved in cell wall biosynthesis